MTFKSISSLFLVWLLLVLALQGNSLAGDKELPFYSTTVGTFSSGNLDTNNDNFPNAIGEITALSKELKVHKVSTQIEVTAPGSDCNTSEGDPGPGFKSTIVQGSSVFIIRDDNETKLDQVFFEITELTQCAELVPPTDAPPDPPARAPIATFVAVGKATVTGGTGKFEGATGWATFTLEGHFDLVAGNPVAGDALRFYGRFTGTQQGTIVY